MISTLFVTLIALNGVSAIVCFVQAARLELSMRSARRRAVQGFTMSAGELFEAARAADDEADFIRRVVGQFGPWGRRT